jgi:hypothetical protein
MPLKTKMTLNEMEQRKTHNTTGTTTGVTLMVGTEQVQ